MPDLQFTNAGSFALMTPVTELGLEWVNEHIGEERQQWNGAIVVEHRYLADIVEGARADGLICEG
jgi:hypothetical protein